MAQSDINIACDIILNNTPAFPVSSENAQSDQTGTHYRATFIPAETENIDIAYSGSQDLTGIFQVLISIPLNKGKSDAITAESELLSKFTRGTGLNYNSQHAEVVKTYMSGGFQNDQWWIIPCTIEYQGFING